MKVLLFAAFLFALAAVTTQATVPCDNPILRLIKGRDWEFPYLAQAIVQTAESKVCPGFANRNSCCDATTYDDLAGAWVKLYAEVVAVRIRLGILQLEVDTLLIEIAAVKDAVQKSTKLTAEEKTAINAFLDAVANAVGVLVPDIIANFVTCYSSVLRFYAGLLCRACDTRWNDWVELVNGSDPLVAEFKFKFAQETCNAFQQACSPFFAPFYNFRNALVTALETLAANIPNNDTRNAVIANLESFRPPCHNVSQCLVFICYRFLQGLDRVEDWSSDSFDNATTTGGGLRRDAAIEDEFPTARVVRALNRVQRTASHSVHTRASGFQGQDYTGTFDPLKQSTGLNTNAQTSAAARASFDVFWNQLNLF